MQSEWLQGLDEDAKKEMRMLVREASRVRRRLISILDNKINTSTRVNRNKTSYDNPNWSLLQADHIGYTRALSEIILLLDEKS